MENRGDRQFTLTSSSRKLKRSGVNFVLYGEKSILAIEVKNSGKVRKTDLRHLKTFCSDYPGAKAILLY